jgi:DNA modification methylase
MVELLNIDCLVAMRDMKDNSVDAVVTDPPYGLSFMGKTWDYDLPSADIWRECLRVLKPGGHLLSFGGTRTYHRMACAIEDAGFEIRDMVEWLYGSGFPKSLHIGKAIDKMQGNERDVFDNPLIKKQTGTTGTVALNAKAAVTHITKGTSQYEGWGTALKPAHEPICMARKPLNEKNVAENVLKHGTGGINIDGCRIEHNEAPEISNRNTPKFNGVTMQKFNGVQDNIDVAPNSQGRFPANLIHDGSDEVVREFPNSTSGGTRGEGINHNKSFKCSSESYIRYNHIPSSNGSAARFFYCAKASKSERNQGCNELEQKERDALHIQQLSKQIGEVWIDRRDGKGKVKVNRQYLPQLNNHPTVKPIALMRYLCKLVTPPNGIVLDPFMGSGTTGIAAKLEGFSFIGIEKEKEYFNIAEARINNCEQCKPDPQQKLF